MARPADEVRCTVIQDRGDRRSFAFRLGHDLRWSAEGAVGPAGISAQAADLIDVALSAFIVEKQVASRATTNPVTRVELDVPVRESRSWQNGGADAAAAVLDGMGLPSWTVSTRAAPRRPLPPVTMAPERGVQQVALFSGGLDSTSGAASIHGQRDSTALVSFYTRQRTLQRELADALDYAEPAQFTMKWDRPAGRGHSFRYRSFLFLALGAVVASSWRANRILQFENGVLASAVPPAPSFNMTRHAHPSLHKNASMLFEAVLGASVAIENPFFFMTKRETVAAAPRRFHDVLRRTETCWYLYANHIYGKKKKLRLQCGACIPCILRRTALPDEKRNVDLNQDAKRNNEKIGRAFRSYYAFLREVEACRDASQFYLLLPGSGRELVMRHTVALADLYQLFRRYAREFFETFP